MSTERILVFVALVVPALVLIGFALYDVVTTRRLSVARKVAWALVIVGTLFIGTLAYFVVRPLPNRRRASHHGGSERSAEFLHLLEQKERGAIDAATFSTKKHAMFAQS